MVPKTIQSFGLSFLFIAVSGCLFLLACSERVYAASSVPKDSGITLVLEYFSDSNWDSDNNGRADMYFDAVDFSVKNTDFSWDANEKHLCTK